MTDERRDEEPSSERHPDGQAELRERADGAHTEQLTDDANLRADPMPPGVDPDEVEDEGPVT